MKILKLIITIITVFILIPIANAEEYSRVKGIVHINSHISSGSYSPDTIVEMAEEKDIQVIIFSENALLKWEYGLPPLKKLMKKSVEMDSLFSYGPKRYMDLITKVNNLHPDMLLLHSAEIAPFYYWSGSPFKKNLTMNRWDEQLLVMGLEAPADYKKMPMVSSFHILRYGKQSILQLWPVLPLIIGLFLLFKKPKAKIISYLLIFLSALFLINNFPFGIPLYDQYHGDQGITPYQQLIDYVNKKGGLTFWSAPEAVTDTTTGGVRIYTPAFPNDLLKATNYTGFASLYEGYREVGGIGGVWDKTLKQYCEGKREKPVWNIGELSYHFKEASGGKEIDEVQTVFIISKFSKEAVLNALKTGKMYAMRRTKEYELVLEDFSIINSEGKVAYMGDEITCEENPQIRIKVFCSDNKERNVNAILIRNGQIIKEFQIAGAGEIDFQDNDLNRGQTYYYRLYVKTQSSNQIISNPIFMKFE